jgi:hypothetical protein
MIKIIPNLCYVTHIGGLQLFLKMYLKLINVLGVKKRKFMFKE